MNTDEPEINVVLETVTSTIRSLTNLVETSAHTIRNHNTVIGNLVEINEATDGRLRTLETKVYALTQELEEARRDHEALVLRHDTLTRSYMVHDHPDDGPYGA